jgi:hypothetical protein
MCAFHLSRKSDVEILSDIFILCYPGVHTLYCSNDTCDKHVVWCFRHCKDHLPTDELAFFTKIWQVWEKPQQTTESFRCDGCCEHYSKAERHRKELGLDLDDVVYYCNECWKRHQH